MFHKTLNLPIINVKPIAIIKNLKINETIYGNLANEHFKMSQMNRKQVYLCRILSEEEPFKNLRMTRKGYILLSVRSHILFCHTYFPR